MLRDFHGDGDQTILRHHLAAVLPGDCPAYFDGRKARTGQPLGEPGLQHVELQKLQHGLQPQRARLHRILEEVRLEEPLGRVHRLFRAQKTQPGAAAPRIASGHAVEHEQTGLGQGQRTLEKARWTRGQIDEEVRRGGLLGALLGGGGKTGLILEGRGREEAEARLHLVDRRFA